MIAETLWVRCRVCMDLFGTGFAESEHREGREAVMPDGRPCRTTEEIVQNA